VCGDGKRSGEVGDKGRGGGEKGGGDHRKLDQREVATRRRRDAAMATNALRVVEPDNETRPERPDNRRVEEEEEKEGGGGRVKMDRAGSFSRE